MSLQLRSTLFPRFVRSSRSTITRFALHPIERPLTKLVAARLVTENYPIRSSRLEVGLCRRRVKFVQGAVVAMWGEVEWFDAARYPDLLTDEEAREWMAKGFAPAANDPA